MAKKKRQKIEEELKKLKISVRRHPKKVSKDDKIEKKDEKIEEKKGEILEGGFNEQKLDGDKDLFQEDIGFAAPVVRAIENENLDSLEENLGQSSGFTSIAEREGFDMGYNLRNIAGDNYSSGRYSKDMHYSGNSTIVSQDFSRHFQPREERVISPFASSEKNNRSEDRNSQAVTDQYSIRREERGLTLENKKRKTESF